MIKKLYIERGLLEHPRAKSIAKSCKLTPIACEHYGEIINPVRQDFRLQKQAQALVLAAHRGNRVHSAQSGYSIAPGRPHYYFSHLLNCPYDCGYCFLQGRYRSAHMVLFINYEDFAKDLGKLAHRDNHPFFFSGYDSDSLALEPLSKFADNIVPLFRKLPATLELRSKSTQIRSLLDIEPCANVIVAFSISPSAIKQLLEPGVPDNGKQIQAMQRLGEMGWPLGLRFEPVIEYGDTVKNYAELFCQIFKNIKPEWIHSATISPLHMPNAYFRRAARRNPEVALYAQPLVLNNGIRSYAPELQQPLLQELQQMLGKLMPEQLIYRYNPGLAAA
ncbi:MAG: spore photoproduct lyase family protein [Candidatus Porifericomitaceae bacterium WSBS_2022_MAG_OTU9]